MKLRVSTDAAASPFLLLGQLSIFRGRVRCLDQIMRPTETAELNVKQTWEDCDTLHMFLVTDCTKLKELYPLNSPSDAPYPSLKDTPPTAEPWHCHHTLPLVSTGTELAVLSNSNAQHSRIHDPKGKDLYPISKPFNMQTLFHRLSLRCNCQVKEDHLWASELPGKSKSRTWQVRGSRARKAWSVKHSTQRRNVTFFFFPLLAELYIFKAKTLHLTQWQ